MNSAARIFFILFLFLCGKMFAQDSLKIKSSDSLNGLLIQKYVKGKASVKTSPVFVSIGDKIIVRTDVDYILWEGILTQVTDSSFTMDDSDVIRFSDLLEISCYSAKNRNHIPVLPIIGGTLIVGGVVILFINGFSPDLGNLLGIPIALVGVLIYTTGSGGKAKGKWRKYLITPNTRISATHLNK